MSFRDHIFCCKALQLRTPLFPPSPPPAAKDDYYKMPITVSLLEQIVVCNKDTRVNTYEEPELKIKMERTTKFPHDIVIDALKSMDVPPWEHPRLIEAVLNLVKVAVHELPVHVIIVDVLVKREGCFEDDPDYIERTRREIRECIETSIYFSVANCKVNKQVTPAAATSSTEHEEKFFFSEKEHVGKLRLNGLEETGSCAICLEKFTEASERLISCLPCKHYYHLACIVKCLSMRQSCPLCRYQMPIIAEVLGTTEESFCGCYLGCMQLGAGMWNRGVWKRGSNSFKIFLEPWKSRI